MQFSPLSLVSWLLNWLTTLQRGLPWSRFERRWLGISLSLLLSNSAACFVQPCPRARWCLSGENCTEKCYDPVLGNEVACSIAEAVSRSSSQAASFSLSFFSVPLFPRGLFPSRKKGESPLSTALPSLFTNGKEKECLSQEPLSTFYRFSLSLPAYITEYNYVAPGIMIVGIGPCKDDSSEKGRSAG